MAHKCDGGQGIERHGGGYVDEAEDAGADRDEDDGADGRHIVLTDLEFVN